MNIDEILRRLKKVKKSGNNYIACCPAHDDATPSLSICEKNNKILLKCHAGCSTQDICTSIGIKINDLFNDNNINNTYNQKYQKNEFIREHIYTDEKGSIIAKKKIFKKPSGEKSASWYRYDSKNNTYLQGLNGLKMPLYNLKDVIHETDTIYLVEGEKDAETVKRMEFTSTTSPNGAGANWNEEYNKYFAGKNVIIIKDNDEAGARDADKKAKSLITIAKTVKIIDPVTLYKGLKLKGDISDVVEAIGLQKAKQSLLDSISSTNIIPQNYYNVKDENEKKPYFTPNNLSEFLLNENIQIRLNDITQKLDIKGLEDESQEHLQANIDAIIYSKIQGLYRYCNMQTVRAYLNVIAPKNRFNPVLEYLSNFNWDGKDRIQELYSIMNIPEDDSLSRTLILKWLWQCISMLHNNFNEPFGAEGVLTLQGEQGIGKTSLFRKLSLKPDFFKEGVYIDFRDKDTFIRVSSCWIAELGEIESTFKSDVERLKAFITQSRDEYRRPFGRGDETPLRRTSLCGSCNSTEFLIDATGNRRFWTVPVENIDLERLDNFDVVQLWKQIQYHAESNLQGFRLTPEERQELNIRNCVHEKKLKGQQEIEDILFKAQQHNDNIKVCWEYMTVTDFKNFYLDELRNYSSAQIGKVLDKIGIPMKKKRINGSIYPSQVRYLPRQTYTSLTYK